MLTLLPTPGVRCHDDRVEGPAVRPLPGLIAALATGLAVASVPLSLGREPINDTVLYAVNAIVLAAAGMLVSSRQPRNAIGWILVGMGVAAALTEAAEGYGYHPTLAGVAQAQWLAGWLAYLNIGAYAVLLTLFPSGRATGPVLRINLWLGVGGALALIAGSAFGHASDAQFSAGANPYAVAGTDWLTSVGEVMVIGSMLVAIWSLISRFRHSTGVERAQLKWLAYVVSALAIVAPFAILFFDSSVIVRIAISIVIPAVPVVICVAVLRYRLYDIDIIINRTLVYTSLTVVLAICYAAVTLTLGAVFGDPRSPLITACSTLTAAAVVRPVRNRIQQVVDRRFRRARFDAMTQVDQFLVDLRLGRAAPDTLEAVLRRAVSLPDLELRYISPADTVLIDALGEPITTDPDDRRTRVDLSRAGVPLAVVLYTGRPGPLQRTVEAVLARALLAIEIVRLQAEVRRQLTEVLDSRAQIIAAGDAERRRIERDLHDGAQQRLLSVGLALRHAQHQLGPSPVDQLIEDAVAQIGVAIAELRELAHGVRPAQLHQGLAPALRELASRSTLTVDVHANDDERFPAEVEATAYFIACEALTNTAKHASAKQVSMRAERTHDHLVISVCDDGVGGATLGPGSGLTGLADRVADHGGRINLTSIHGHGTTLIAQLPCG